MGNFLQLKRYERQYGKNNIHEVELEEDGSFYLAVHHTNLGRIHQDFDNGNCFLWRNKLIWTNRS